MKRALFVPFLLAAPLAAFVLPAAQTPPTCPNTIPHEPILLYDQSGGTLGGFYDRALTVYADGTARLSSFTPNFGPSKSELQFVGQDAVNQLFLALAQSGAGTLCDNFAAVADLPPSTLTLMRGTPDSAAHTFSWYVSIGAYASVDQSLQTFIQTYFPNF